MSPEVRIKELFAKQQNETITLEEWRELNDLLMQAGHHYGDVMPGYLCPNPKCLKPLMFYWSDGLACWHHDGGCGWHYPSPSPYAMREG